MKKSGYDGIIIVEKCIPGGKLKIYNSIDMAKMLVPSTISNSVVIYAVLCEQKIIPNTTDENILSDYIDANLAKS